MSHLPPDAADSGVGRDAVAWTPSRAVFAFGLVSLAADMVYDGPKAAVLARFVPVVRTLVPAVAGMGQMPRCRFTVYNLAGGLVWAVGMLLAGFLLGGIPFIAANIELLALASSRLRWCPLVSPSSVAEEAERVAGRLAGCAKLSRADRHRPRQCSPRPHRGERPAPCRDRDVKRTAHTSKRAVDSRYGLPPVARACRVYLGY